MTIKTNEELRMFENAIDRCNDSLLLITPEGTEFDLKTPMGRHQGIASMLNQQGPLEPELFATSYEDEAVLINYIRQCKKIA